MLPMGELISPTLTARLVLPKRFPRLHQRRRLGLAAPTRLVKGFVPDLPIALSHVPPVTLAIPDSLLYQGLSAGGHRQRVSLSWYDDLRFDAVAPGCAPITLRCPVRTILTHGCRR